MKKMKKNDSGCVTSDNDCTDEYLPNVENAGTFVKRKKNQSNTAPHYKKIKSNKYTKQPTTEELNRLRETENLFSSNFFRLQIEEVLNEVKVKPKCVSYFNTWLIEFNNFLETLEDSEDYAISDISWLEEINVAVPFLLETVESKGFFKFVKCEPAVVVGSLLYDCCLGPDLHVDIKINMPNIMFQKDDYLNERYHRKKSLCLAYLASKLRSSDLVDDIKYMLLNESIMRPILHFKPRGKANKHINIALHLCTEECTFKLERFFPSKNNVRESWRFELNNDNANSLSISTPYYNMTILMDLVYNRNNDFLCKCLEKCDNIKQGILLLKIWLKQRGIFGFSGFIITMYVAYLVNIRRINNAMSSYQVVRNVWSALCASEWDKNGISLQSLESKVNTSDIQNYHTHFPIVFIDCTGYYNICTNVSLEVYNNVKYESKLAVGILDNQNINGFSSLFMTPINFYFKYDHVLRLEYTKKLENAVLQNTKDHVKLDRGLDKFPIVQNYVCSLLVKGLGQRICLITPKCLNPEERKWQIDSQMNKANPLQKFLIFGIRLNPDHAFSLIDKGPQANLLEAIQFREFWGPKSELRRFQDGSISEACVWESNSSMAAKRLIVKKIIFYLLQMKLGIEKKIFYIADQFEDLLHNNRFQPSNFDYGTGEEATVKVNAALDNLMKNLRSLTEMPLEISSVQGISSIFSYTDPIPPLAYAPPTMHGFILHNNYRLIKKNKNHTVVNKSQSTFRCPAFVPVLHAVLQLSFSGKWPENLEAFYRIKAAFYIQIAEALKQQCSLTVYPHPKYIDVLKDGFIFRLQIAHIKEILLMKKTVDADGIVKYRDTDESLDVELDLIQLPKLRVALNGLYHQYPSFGPTVCIMKRWLNAHLIDSFHFPDICIDLLIASIFITPEPYEVSFQPQVIFWRALHLLSNTDWTTQMILLNFNNTLKKEEIVGIENNFYAMRSSLPPLYIVTSFEEKKCSIWSKVNPSFNILARIKILATEALHIIENVLFMEKRNDIRTVFKPNTEGFDVIIYIKKSLNPFNYMNLQNEDINSVSKIANMYEKKEMEFIPIIGFNPIQMYLSELRSSYDEYALFFHDTYGGNEIGVLWKPQMLEYKEFKTSTCNGRRLVKKDGKFITTIDLDAILDGFCILGEGLIENIENVTNITL